MERTFKARTVDDWRPEPGDSVTGKIHELGAMVVNKRQTRFFVVDTGTALVRVWHSDGLEPIFAEGAKGDSVNVEFRRKKEIGRGQHFNVFAFQLWTEGPSAKEPAPPAPATDPGPKG